MDCFLSSERRYISFLLRFYSFFFVMLFNCYRNAEWISINDRKRKNKGIDLWHSFKMKTYRPLYNIVPSESTEGCNNQERIQRRCAATAATPISSHTIGAAAKAAAKEFCLVPKQVRLSHPALDTCSFPLHAQWHLLSIRSPCLLPTGCHFLTDLRQSGAPELFQPQSS